ncbi:MAG: LamG domain-containing protein, partial [Planctomycetota bacterium]
MCRKLVFLISFVVASILVNSATAGVSVHFSFDGSQGADLPASVQDDTGSVTFQKVIDTHPSGSIGSLTYGEPNPFYNRGGTSANFVHASTLWRDVVEGPDILDLNDVEYTVEMFIKVNDWANDREQQVIFKKYTSDYVVEVLDAGSLRYSHAGEGAAGTIVTDPCVISLGQWYHIAFVFDSADTVTPQKIYIDGTQAASGGTTDLNPGSDEPVGIAAMTRPEYTRKDWLAANIDEFRISDEALAPSEFLLNQTFDPRFASRPSPGTGAENFCDGAELCWQPGLYAAEHDVYLGTDFNDVNDAVTTSGVYEGPQGPNCFTTSGLQPGTTYYWRIDEVNDVCSPYLWKGDVWNFTTNDGTAYDPEPSDGETKVPFDVVLGWTGGCLAVSHDVYFGTDVDAVSDATTDVHPDVEYDNVGSPSYDPTTEFDYLTVYYWRVDEVGPSSQRWKGTVWSLRSVSAIVDPNMIIWYKLDESEGETANDDSGYENHAHVDGPDEGPAWDPAEGRYGGSLGFDDDTDVEVPIGAMGSVSTGITVSLWLKDAYRSGSYNWVFEAPGPGGVRVQAAVVEEDNDDVYWRAGNDTNDVLTWDMAREDLDPKTLEGWHHWAFIKDEVAGAMSIYFDGEVKESNDVVDSTVANIRNGQMRFGVGGGSANTYIGKIDEVKVFNKALTAKEVAALFRGGELELAWAPQPIDNAKDVPRDVLLEWRPGDFADQHDVYFGTAFDDVNDAGTANTSIYKGRRALDANSYDPPGELDLETTYYWRIDEVNSSDPNVWKGKVWRFTVANFLIVDDMESYNAIPGSGNEVFDTWDDGFMNWTGSQIALEYSGGTTHGGEQSMKVQYDNAIAYYKYSEVDANTTGPRPGNLDIGVDWTILGVEALTVFFYGTPGNDANEQMYVALTDNSNNMAISRY